LYRALRKIDISEKAKPDFKSSLSVWSASQICVHIKGTLV